MRNFIKCGKTMTFTAPTGGVVSENPYLIGTLLAIATDTIAATLPFEGMVEGVFTLAKTTSQAWVEGQAAFWDVANAKVSTDPTVGLPVGVVGADADSADTTGVVRLNGGGAAGSAGGILNVRKRFTIAQINAGATLIPALPGIKIRMVDGFAISVGGAAAAVTTVDILATLTSSRKLVAFGQAALTQSALIRAGGTGGVILADGASFTANDAGTAVTVGKTGSDVTTATHIDISCTYSLE